MGLLKKDRINLMLTDHVVRYLYQNNQTSDHGEIKLEPGLIEDGKIIDKPRFIGVLKALVKEKNWRNKEVAFCVPDAFVTLRDEAVPKQLSGEEIKQYIEMELDNSIRLPFKNPVIDYEIIKQEEDLSHILLFAYPKDRLESYIDVFHQANCKLTIADFSFLSVYRVFATHDLINKEAHLLLIQWRKADIVLTVFHNDRPIFNRHIYLEGASVSNNYHQEEDNASNSIDQEPFQSIVEEQFVTIERFMDFYQYSITNNSAQIDRMALAGDSKYHLKIKSLLEERFNLSVQTPLNNQELPLEYTELYGLTLRK
ncbi:type IV pilus biogenesis protein PilM [Paraliobacillus sp. JSM ZJ581]|uniref:type IV pilus biogenesis protein PilM n=1 Tax=Paraliobacillus sp. JSM ZJ581 TaxID=3342118 RepID=UPI0035A93591